VSAGRRAVAGLGLALGLLLGAGAAAAAGPAVDEAVVTEVAAQLRCVVCQNLSVADSPSETAQQMRAIIRERLARGDSPAQVRDYFVERYGVWILLSPPRKGFTLLVWVVPFAGLALGLLAAALAVRRWRRAAAPAGPEPAGVDPAMRERIRRELAELEPPGAAR
jgi:cytochrome c-type biogenesis protein CcmH